MTIRRPSIKQLASRRRKRAEARLDRYRELIYQTFLSESSYRKRNEPIPEDAVRILRLDAKWCNYTGYAPKEEGERLLRRYAWAEVLLEHRKDEWEDAYYPGRRQARDEAAKIRLEEEKARKDEREAWLASFTSENRQWIGTAEEHEAALAVERSAWEKANPDGDWPAHREATFAEIVAELDKLMGVNLPPATIPAAP